MSTSWNGTRTSFPPADRARILRRDKTCRCGGCPDHDGPCDQPATIADHITPVAEGGTHDWRTNGQGLCGTSTTGCHGHKTRAEQARGRIRKGKRRPPDTTKHPGLR